LIKTSLKKVIIPVAGLGTRMLPVTKAIPKEMLPIVNKPIIQFIVEEAAQAGFKEIIFVTHSSKYSIQNHFDKSFELEATLEKRVRRSLLKEIRSISNLNLAISTVRQHEAKGLGHAILCAKSIVGEEPFAVMLPDMIIDGSSKANNLSMMKKSFQKNAISSILLGVANRSEIRKYGIAKLKKIRDKNSYIIQKIIEKPSLQNAPSNRFAVGRYVFENKIFEYLAKTGPDKSGEIQLTEAIDSFLKKGNQVFGFPLNGKVFDCGEKTGYLSANLEFAKKDPLLKRYIKNYMKNF